MKIDRAISDAARAAGIRVLIANDVHLGLTDRRGIRRRFFKSSFGWIEADSTAWGWRATVRHGAGPLFERAVSGMARGGTLDETAAGGVEIFPSAIAAIRAAAPGIEGNGNGYVDYWDQVRIRGTFTNTTAQAITGIKAIRRISFRDFSDTSSWSLDSLAAGETKSMTSGPVYLSHDQVAYLAAGYRFDGYVSITQVGTFSYEEGEHPADVTTAAFGIYDPLLPENIVVSEPTAEHIDADGDGEGDRGEIVRVSFKAKNTGGLAAGDVSFEIGFTGWPAATSYCDRASLLSGSTMSCSVDVELTKDYLGSLGEPGTAVALNGAVSLFSLTGEHFASGAHQTALPHATRAALQVSAASR